MREGGGGDDDLRAGPTSDVLRGGSGADTMFGGSGADTMFGGSGADTMFGGSGADLFDGGSSLDTVSYLEDAHDGARVVVTLDDVADDGTHEVGRQRGATACCPNVQTLVGNSGNDVLIGNALDNTLIGNDGNDILIGLGGKDRLNGGLGDDQLAGNDPFGAPVNDGSNDVLDAGDGTRDSCRVFFRNVEADITIGCETINQD
jgi:Ca2+-binding RTX toxin-like protein